MAKDELRKNLINKYKEKYHIGEELEKMSTLDMVNLMHKLTNELLDRGWGLCLCGCLLPNVACNETPYQFCSRECKDNYLKKGE
jgi:hypothetical protein